jgi:CDP-diacylglycerol--serine O-phosphatidyltransferase
VKKIAILPTLLTLGNAVCGFASIAYAGKIDGTEATERYFSLCGWLIVAAMIFDALDGYVARLSRTASKFGGELDSLCDAISFGAAPAFLLLRLGPTWDHPLLHQTLAVIATLYVVCAVLRLARFNVENNPDPAYHKRFRGLPSPAAAGCLASLAVLRGELGRQWPGVDTALVHSFVEIWATAGALTVALLMVSRVPYPHATKQALRGRRNFNAVVQAVLAVAIVALVQQLALVIIFWTYTLGVLARYVLVRNLNPNALRPATPGVDDVSLPH